MKRKLKLALTIIILATTLGLFVHYAATHPDVIRKVGDLTPGMLALLLVFYAMWFAAISVVLKISLAMYNKPISKQENLLLNAYSSLVNFFGPGQSGPAFRGLYLKKRHNFSLKHYIFTTLLYYAFYAVLSAFLLCVGSRPWWQTALLMIAAAISSVVVIKWYSKRSSLKDQPGVNPTNMAYMFGAVALQMVAQVGIYYVELHNVSPGVSFSQILTYTGAANFALFVSLTPGAIGIREAFLVFSQGLHHISNSAIVAANIIDRAAYLVVLGIMFVAVVTLHAKDKLHVRQVRASSEKAEQADTPT
ncbi:MAG TPA: lysylphosphatidylglycerol synthase domain-containing protein [Candidatus Saccharimonadales bacterium]|nr:lysylphosphatidylglycerol synthase domain-containing protein [Candidatus Saccharimonadales bacterium]